MIRIVVHNKKTEKEIARLGRRLPTKTIDAIREIGNRLEQEMRAEAPYWHGNLQSSIVVKPETKNKLSLQAIFYWRFVEEGHAVNSIPPKLKGWIIQKAGSEAYPRVANALLAKGAMPHPFVEPAINTVRKEVHNILKKHLNS